MKFGVGTKRGIMTKFTLLLSFLLFFSILDVFSMTTYDTNEEELVTDFDEPLDDMILPKLHGTKASEPYWTSLSGSFPSSLPDTDDYFSIDFGDVNNDGKLDIVAGAGENAVPGGIHCWVGDGTGEWQEQSDGLSTSGWCSDVEVDDLNNDGKLDIACDGKIYTGNGGKDGSMTWTQQSSPGPWNGVALGDINDDGNLDIATGRNDGVKVWTGNGGAGGVFDWTPSSGGLITQEQYFGVYLGDVNNDGKLDIAAGSNNDTGVKVWTGNGESGALALWTDAFTGTGLPTTGFYRQVCFGDANNDGKLDLAAAKSQGVQFWKGNGGEGGFTWTEESDGLTASGNFYGLSFGDVNNDGKLDLIGAEYNGDGVQVWLGDGGEGDSMNWTSAREGLPGSSKIIDLCLGDVNNDGRIDIGATTRTQGVQVWAGNLPDLAITGWASYSTGLPTGSGWYDVIFGDIDHDGDLDLAAGSNPSTNLGMKVWLGDGNGNWDEISDPDLPSSGGYDGLRLIDANHDGDLDLIAGNNVDGVGSIEVYFGNGSGGFGPATRLGGTTDRMGGVEVADINNNGNIDIASGYYFPGNKAYVWLDDGSGAWSDTPINPTPDLGYDDVAFGDVDHNGTIDLFATTHMNGFRFWLGDGNGNWILQPQNGLPTDNSGLGASFGDVNHDGNLDIAVGAWATGPFGVRVYTSDGGADGEVDWTNSSVGLPTAGRYAGVELGDINNDGNLDILSANCGVTTNGISLCLGNGGQGGPMVWTESVLPDLPSSGTYWGVAFGDVNNDGILDIAITSGNGVEVYITQTRPSYRINLEEGWNLISLPMIQSDTSIAEVFTSIDGEYKAVQYFDSRDANDPWKHYHVQKLPMNDLAEVNHTQGIWILITKPGGTTLTVFGDEINTTQSITIRPGWNLVGYPSLGNKNRTTALNNIDFDTDVDSIWTYDASAQQWKEIGEQDNFEVSKGYWVRSLRD
ncbi:MAG: VCBS repeat-containing protein [Methanomassiliicoccales archaeon]|nr:MAG: VCBS repeat-containing protein [Methanomassiliicoccales archaeon]